MGGRSVVEEPSSSTIPRAALSAFTAAASSDPGRATSVGWISGRSPWARPSSPKFSTP
ncbi:hypothetical protein ACFVJS_22680 [Nocardioides sp. NPDC057772]|uniref:hypothetical protein n=1 Tax=Nocardioides sp. NPDC057772 TaxID=3346245 RepID=UPI00366FB5DB